MNTSKAKISTTDSATEIGKSVHAFMAIVGICTAIVCALTLFSDLKATPQKNESGMSISNTTIAHRLVDFTRVSILSSKGVMR